MSKSIFICVLTIILTLSFPLRTLHIRSLCSLSEGGCCEQTAAAATDFESRRYYAWKNKSVGAAESDTAKVANQTH